MLMLAEVKVVLFLVSSTMRTQQVMYQHHAPKSTNTALLKSSSRK
jgi:hypothetical protein